MKEVKVVMDVRLATQAFLEEDHYSEFGLFR